MQNAIKLSLAALLAISLSSCGGKGGNSADRGGGGEDEYGMPQQHTSLAGGIELALIPNGTFEMGVASNNGSLFISISDAKPKHNVTISKPYYLGIYEVTQEQWLSVSNLNPSLNTYWSASDDTSQHPVENIKYPDALGFIQALNEHEPNITIEGEQYVYDLPSEAEWEYAARGGVEWDVFLLEDGTYTSSNLTKALLNYAWFKETSNDSVADEWRVQAVGQKQPNPYGLYDVYGNVAEMTLDIGTISKCKYLAQDMTDPLCYDEGSTDTVTKGSQPSQSSRFIYSAYRLGYGVNVGHPNRGFRIALVAKSVRDNMTKWNTDGIIQ